MNENHDPQTGQFTSGGGSGGGSAGAMKSSIASKVQNSISGSSVPKGANPFSSVAAAKHSALTATKGTNVRIFNLGGKILTTSHPKVSSQLRALGATRISVLGK